MHHMKYLSCKYPKTGPMQQLGACTSSYSLRDVRIAQHSCTLCAECVCVAMCPQELRTHSGQIIEILFSSNRHTAYSWVSVGTDDEDERDERPLRLEDEAPDCVPSCEDIPANPGPVAAPCSRAKPPGPSDLDTVLEIGLTEDDNLSARPGCSLFRGNGLPCDTVGAPCAAIGLPGGDVAASSLRSLTGCLLLPALSSVLTSIRADESSSRGTSLRVAAPSNGRKCGLRMCLEPSCIGVCCSLCDECGTMPEKLAI
jgi:hypothetical protein